VHDANWEGTYSRPTGVILTVHFELGEPMHKVVTRGVKVWKEFDDTVFSLPKEKWAAWLVEHRAEIIKKLNADFAKMWFGWKKDGLVAEDLGDISYEEVTYNRSTVEYYQSIYQTIGSRRSALTAVPFNRGSKQDVEALVDYIYATLRYGSTLRCHSREWS
jgi:enoyl reductase-like protein